MRRFSLICLMFLVACKASHPKDSQVAAADSTRPNTTVFSRDPGGSMRLSLGYGVMLNERTSLQREWIAAHDSTAPVDLVGSPGITTAYRSGGSYSYGAYEGESQL